MLTPHNSPNTATPAPAAAGRAPASAAPRPSLGSGLLYTVLRHGLGRSHREACEGLEQALVRPGSPR